MRHTISWSDLPDGRVAVWGMGMEGEASVRRLKTLGIGHVVVDDAPQDASILPTEGPGLAAMLGCEVVIKTPGISRSRPEVGMLEDAGVAVVGGLGLWLHDADRSRVVCVTGTKGKSTTATILGHLLVGLGRRPFVGGNLGRPPFAPEVDPADHDVWIIETSSYQATDLADAPGVVCVTSLSPDHLPWHGKVEDYYRDKLSICTLPGPHVTVANGADPTLRANAELLGPDVRWVDAPEQRPAWLDGLGLLGAHNDRNALMAAACLEALGIDAEEGALASAAAGMQPLDSRLQPVGTVGGVTFVDDSLSTNTLPTIAAVEAFAGRPVALLVGGQDRGIDYAPLGEFIRSRPDPTLVVAMPTNGPRILADMGEVSEPASTAETDDLPHAVEIAFRWAVEREGVVLLSPAAPSFDRFRDYRHRATVFIEAMHALTPSTG
ncbi:UDP-N-acetylmuramoyl-L-alanine--D-glutamate ligase [soil metagenome]